MALAMPGWAAACCSILAVAVACAQARTDGVGPATLSSAGAAGQGGSSANQGGAGAATSQGGQPGAGTSGSAGSSQDSGGSGGTAGSAGSSAQGGSAGSGGGSLPEGGAAGAAGEAGSPSGDGTAGASQVACGTSFSLTYKALQTDASANVISADIKFWNSGSAAVDLGTIKMRYYFTNDTPSPPGLVGSSGYLAKTPSGGGYVELNDKKVDSLVPEIPAQYAAAYFELGFENDPGDLDPGDSILVHLDIHRSDYGAALTQTDDYSFNAAATSETSWRKITLYCAGDLAWGDPPN